jgi:arogenate dehydrogenase (NADP+)
MLRTGGVATMASSRHHQQQQQQPRARAQLARRTRAVVAPARRPCSVSVTAAAAGPTASSSPLHAWSRRPSAGAATAAAAAAGAGRHPPSSSATTTTPTRTRHRRPLRVSALDAALPFDFEHRARRALESERKLTVGIVGFGTFGQFLARRLAAAGHRVLATSRADYSREAQEMGVAFFSDADAFCEEHPEVVVLATSILSTERVLRALPLQRLKRSTLFVDVLSVKAFPKQLLQRLLPPETDILCTHPMFGPDSGRGSWQGLNLMYERVRVLSDADDGARREARCANLLRFFADEGCRMVEMACEEHDRVAASTQFITHTVGRVLGAMDLRATPIDTRGYKALLELVDNTRNDSFELYYGLFLYNRASADELERLERALDQVKGGLFDQLHEIARRQIFPATPPGSPGSASDADGAPNGGRGAARGRDVVAELLPAAARSLEEEEEEEAESNGRALPPVGSAPQRRLGDGSGVVRR